MRTTLEIEDDVLIAARELARQRKSTVGRVLSDLAREALTRTECEGEDDDWPTFPVRPNGVPVTLELVNRLRDEAP